MTDTVKLPELPREAFEAWLASTYPPGYGDWYAWKNPDGTYTYTQKEWEAWTASRLQAMEECAKVCDRRVVGDHNREDAEAARCARDIRSLAGERKGT